MGHADKQRLRLLLNELHPADLAQHFAQMDRHCRLSCFRLLDLDNAGAVLAQLEPVSQVELLQELGELSIVPIITGMPPDDAVDLLSELPPQKVKSIIEKITDLSAAEDIEELMAFEEDTAGGIMSTDYLSLPSGSTAQEALTRFRQAYQTLEEETYDAYVTDAQEKLLGRVSLKALLMASPQSTIDSLMDRNLIKVSTDTDQEAAAQKLSRYDLLSLPVVDADGKLCGIITADDVIDVIQEEATEDILQSSGIDTTGGESHELLSYNVPLSFRARIPWLVVTLSLETLSAIIINGYDKLVQQTVAAAAFMPLLSGVTGSVAVQSTCIVIAGINSGQLNWKAVGKNLLHETKVGILLGMACGLITSVVAISFHQATWNLGVVVGISLFTTMMMGITLGTLMPLMFKKIGIEPAHASGPFITSLLDVLTFSLYLQIVHILLSRLLQP